jgi:hypothetical protein
MPRRAFSPTAAEPLQSPLPQLGEMSGDRRWTAPPCTLARTGCDDGY